MSDLTKLPLWMSGGCVHVVVETPRLARVKLAYEPELESFVMSRALMLGLAFPYDWGFLPSTLGEDGDPLDALIIHDAETSPGLVVRCRIAGVLKVEQKEDGKSERNDRFIAVPDHDHRAKDLDDARDLSKAVKSEIEKFFEASVATEDKELKFLGWAGPKEALKLIKDGEKALIEQSD
jgi:inorganic pyrophosphatase